MQVSFALQMVAVDLHPDPEWLATLKARLQRSDPQEVPCLIQALLKGRGAATPKNGLPRKSLGVFNIASALPHRFCRRALLGQGPTLRAVAAPRVLATLRPLRGESGGYKIQASIEV